MVSSSIVSIVNLIKSGLLEDWSLGVPLRHLEYPDVVYLLLLGQGHFLAGNPRLY